MGMENAGFARLEQLFGKGALKGKAGKIVEEALAAGVEPKLLAAVIAHETGRGTSNAVLTKNNPGGIMDWENNWETIRSFPTLDEGIKYTARNLRRRLGDSGGDMVKLKALYAPDKAKNDPKGLNKNWLDGVNKFYNYLGPTETPSDTSLQQGTLTAK